MIKSCIKKGFPARDLMFNRATVTISKPTVQLFATVCDRQGMGAKLNGLAHLARHFLFFNKFISLVSIPQIVASQHHRPQSVRWEISLLDDQQQCPFFFLRCQRDIWDFLQLYFCYLGRFTVSFCFHCCPWLFPSLVRVLRRRFFQRTAQTNQLHHRSQGAGLCLLLVLPKMIYLLVFQLSSSESTTISGQKLTYTCKIHWYHGSLEF